MINVKFLLPAFTGLLLSGNTQASEVKSLTFVYSDSPQATTKLSSYELKPLSALDNAVKLANVRFITDVGDMNFGLNSSNVDTNLDTNTACKDAGFTLTSCDKGKIPDETSRCPNNTLYFKYCLCDTSYYNVTLEGSETIIGVCGKLAQTESCTDKKGTHYNCKCSTTGLTTCNNENEYVNSADNQLATGNFCKTERSQELAWFPQELCLTCESPLVTNASKSGCSCPVEYKECDLGPEVGANSCTENGITKYNNCKACANLGTHTTCPDGYICSFEDCSEKYYTIGCATGYISLDDCSWKCKFTQVMPKN